MLLDMLMVLKLMALTFTNSLPYAVLAILPAILCTRLAIKSWNI